MTRTYILAAALLAGLAGCKRSMPRREPEPAAVAPPPAPMAAAPRSADTRAARAQNRQGMKRYKAKDYAGAAAAFRAALAADPGHVLARYNLACVLALTGARAEAIAELEGLARSQDPAALRALARGQRDEDLRSLREDPKTKQLFSDAAERALFIGFKPLARGTEASEAESAALQEQEEGDRDNAMSVRGELLKARPGDEIVVLSLRAAVLLDGARRPIATDRSLGESFAEAKSGGIAHLWIGQVVANEEPEIVAYVEWSGRRVQGSTLTVLKRRGDELAVILEVPLYRAEFEVPDDGAGDDAEITSTDTYGEIELLPDGRLRRRTWQEQGRKKTEILRWDPGRFAFVADVGKKFKGAWFEIAPPPGYRAVARDKAVTGNGRRGPDGASFLSPDGGVEFYVYSPQSDGESLWLRTRPEERLATGQPDRSKPGTEVTPLTFSGPGYTRIYEDHRASPGSARWGFGLLFRAPDTVVTHRAAFESFKASLEQLTD